MPLAKKSAECTMHTLIVPRADNEQSHTLDAFEDLEQLGITILPVPLFNVLFNLDIPEAYKECSAVCATSRNGLRALSKLSLQNRDFLFVTGPASASMALEMDYKRVFSSKDGHASGMIQVIGEHAHKFTKPLLYLRGDVVKTDLKEHLSKLNIPTLEYVAYELHLYPAGHAQLKGALSQNPLGITVLSQRIAHVLCDIFKEILPEPNLLLFSLSADISKVLATTNLKTLEANAPNLSSLSQLIKKTISKPL